MFNLQADQNHPGKYAHHSMNKLYFCLNQLYEIHI